MCGRFTLRHSRSDLADWLKTCKVNVELPDMRPRFNIAPSQVVCSITADGDGVFSAAMRRWGLLPGWAKDLKAGYTMINARSETVATKPAFRQAFSKRRCLVLADGFYEWLKEGKARLPVWFSLVNGTPFALAGIWEAPPKKLASSAEMAAVPADGTVSLLTTSANETVRPFHDRMPVLLPVDVWKDWLGDISTDQASAMLQPFPAEYMKSRRVTKLVNSPKHDVPECLQEERATLF